MKPRIGDIWLDEEGEHSLVLGFEPYNEGQPERIKVSLYVLDSHYVKDGGEDYTFVEIDAFGPDRYMYKLISRIDNAKEED
jgi:hypothetical protein